MSPDIRGATILLMPQFGERIVPLPMFLSVWHKLLCRFAEEELGPGTTLFCLMTYVITTIVIMYIAGRESGNSPTRTFMLLQCLIK